MEITNEEFEWLMDIAKRFLAWNPLNTALKQYYKRLEKRYIKNEESKMQKMWENFNKLKEY